MEYKDILESLLEGYEQGGHQNVDAYLREKGQEMGLSEESLAKVESASAAIDRLAANMESLHEAKESGHTLKRWLMDKLQANLSPVEDCEAKAQFINKLTAQVEKGFEQQLIDIE